MQLTRLGVSVVTAAFVLAASVCYFFVLQTRLGVKGVMNNSFNSLILLKWVTRSLLQTVNRVNEA